MKILMISMDKTLLGAVKSGGDAIERHKRYGEFCDELNIIVFCKKGFQKQQLSDNVFVWSTNSLTRWSFFCNAYKIGKQIYKNSPFDLVIGDIFTSWPAWRLKRKFKIKFLMHFHGDFWNNISGLEKKWHNYFLLIFSKFLAHKADAIRVVSNGIKDKLIKANIKKNKIHVIPTPVDLNKFLIYDRSRVFELKNKYKNKKVLLFVGRLEKVKNLDWFFYVYSRIKKEYKNLIFLIAGDGSQKQNLKLKSEKLKLKNSVIFLNKIDYNDLTNYYQIADIFVLPSLSESFGSVLVQAGASETPCTVTATTGAKEIIKDGYNGLLVPINNANLLADKILYLLNNPEKAKQIGENGRKLVIEKYNNNTEKIIKLWKNLVF